MPVSGNGVPPCLRDLPCRPKPLPADVSKNFLTFDLMKETIARKIAALTKKAKQGKPADVKLAASSSLHRVIKTKEQADFFMKLLKEAR